MKSKLKFGVDEYSTGRDLNVKFGADRPVGGYRSPKSSTFRKNRGFSVAFRSRRRSVSSPLSPPITSFFSLFPYFLFSIPYPFLSSPFFPPSISSSFLFSPPSPTVHFTFLSSRPIPYPLLTTLLPSYLLSFLFPALVLPFPSFPTSRLGYMAIMPFVQPLRITAYGFSYLDKEDM